MKNSVLFTGQVFDQKRRVVVRGGPVGNLALGQVTAVRRAHRSSGGREPVAHARGRRPVRVSAQARVQPRHLRPDARVLEATRVGKAVVPRNPSVPAAQKPRLRPGSVMTVERRREAFRVQRRLAVRAPGKRVLSTSSEGRHP